MNNPESEISQIEKYIENAIALILQRSPVIGFGKDGVVLKVEKRRFDQETIERLKSEGIDLEQGNVAAKILKIYHPGDGQREFDLQTRAFDVLSSFGESCAFIPKPILLKIHQLSEGDREYLKSFGTFTDNEAEIILMDYIEGKDLATLVYDFIILRNHYDEATLENLDFEQKQEIVSDLLEFVIPVNRQKGDFRDIIATRDNVRKLMSYLKKNNYHIDQNILDRIRLSIKMLESNGIFHNDLHERNIMIDNDGNPYIIDFGRAVQDKSDQTSDDFMIVKRFEDLNKEDSNIDDFNNCTNLISRILKSQKWLKLIGEWKKDIKSNKYEHIYNYITSYSTDETLFDQSLAAIASIYISSEEDETKKIVLQILDNLTSKVKQIYLSKKISTYKKYLAQYNSTK